MLRKHIRLTLVWIHHHIPLSYPFVLREKPIFLRASQTNFPDGRSRERLFPFSHLYTYMYVYSGGLRIRARDLYRFSPAFYRFPLYFLSRQFVSHVYRVFRLHYTTPALLCSSPHPPNAFTRHHHAF